MMTSSHERVYFYCYPPKPRGDGSYSKAYHYYQHAIVVLGEGLKELGIEVYANTNYWKLSPDHDDYLFRHDPEVTPNDCSMVVFCNIFLLSGGFPANLFHPQRQYLTVFLDISDEDPRKGCFHADYQQFDLIFKSHRTRKSWYPDNFRPWMFGVSHRILQALTDIPNFAERQHHVLVNYRHRQNPHTLRTLIEHRYLPKLQSVLPLDRSIDPGLDPLNDNHTLDADTLMQLAQSSGRHFPAYYERLKSSVACACFGGYFIAPHPKDQSTPISHNLRRIITKLNLKTDRIIQWDSWRLWESLVAGCVAFHVDFDKYGFVLPTMPQNWTHYIGIDLDQPQASIDRLHDEPEILAQISAAGRQWALTHYTPKAIAHYFLNTVSHLRSGN